MKVIGVQSFSQIPEILSLFSNSSHDWILNQSSNNFYNVAAMSEWIN